MAYVPKVPYAHPVVPSSIPNGLQSYQDGFNGAARGDLSDQLKASLPKHHEGLDLYALLSEVYDIYKFGPEHPYVKGRHENAQAIFDRLRMQDVTSLSKGQHESEEHVRQIIMKARGEYFDKDGNIQQILDQNGVPLSTAGVCLHGMIDNQGRVNPHLRILGEMLKDRPEIHAAFVNNFENGDLSAKDAARHVRDGAKLIRSAGAIDNPIDVDTVLDFVKWVEAYKPGKSKKEKAALKEQAREKLLAVYEVCHKHDLILKVIQKASAHAWNKNFFESLYDSSAMSLDLDGKGNGADCNKNGTGFPAKRPYNNFVSVDRTFPEVVIPMMLATRDFNTAYGLKGKDARWTKYSGKNSSEVDAAALSFLHEHILGPDVKQVNGAGEAFYRRQLEAVFDLVGEERAGFSRHAFDDSPSVDEIPAAQAGVFDPLNSRG